MSPAHAVSLPGFPRPPQLHFKLILWMIIVAAPAGLAVALARFSAGGLWMLASVNAGLLVAALRKDRFAALAIVVSSLPGIVYFRGFGIPFNTPLLLLAAAVGFALTDGALFQRFWRNGLVKYLVLAMIAYWAITALLQGHYSANIQAVGMALCVLAVYLLAERRAYLGTMLVAFGISAILVGAGFLPHGGRLGMLDIDGDTRAGNPILLGLACALTLFAAVAQGGRFVLLHDRPWIRNLIIVSSAILLFLSTSRGGWAVAITCLGVLALFDRHARGRLVRAAIAGGLAFGVLLSTPLTDDAVRTVERIFDPERSVGSKTSGRSEQWKGFPAALMAAPLIGHGPGNGREVSREYAGMYLLWHSLYLHVGVELGLAGLALLFVCLLKIWGQAYAHWKRCDEAMPIAALAGYCAIGLSVMAIDYLSGIFLGLSIATAQSHNFYVRREMILCEETVEPEAVEAL